MSGRPFAKGVDLISPTYAGWVRRQACYFCGRAAPSEHHHFPGRGRRGATFDLDSIPVCLWCHRRCEGITVIDPANGRRLEPISDGEQSVAVCVVWHRFFYLANWSEIEVVMAEMKAHRDARIWVEF